MIRDDKKLRLPPDLYARNFLYQELIEFFLQCSKQPQKQFQILDVGGFSGKLAWFVPDNVKLTVFDQSEAPSNSATNYIQGNINQINFSANSFDLVISSDLIEHLKEDERQIAIEKMCQISKRYLILAAPFASPFNQKAEEIINSLYQKNHRQAHPYLSEHLENGLPQTESVEQYFNFKNYSYYKVSEGNINNWFLNQLYQHALSPELLPNDFGDLATNESNPASTKIKTNTELFKDRQLAFFRYWNENLSRLGNFRQPCYRTVYCLDLQGKIDQKALSNHIDHLNNFHTGSYLQGLNIAFQDLRDVIFHQKYRHQQDSAKYLLDQQSRLKAQAELAEAKERFSRQESLFKEQIVQTERIFQEGQKKLKNQQQLNHELENERFHMTKALLQKEEIAKSLLEKNHQLFLDLQTLKNQISEQENNQKHQIDQIKTNNLLLEQKIAELLEQKQQDNLAFQQLQSSLMEHKLALESMQKSLSWKLIKMFGKIKQFLYNQPKNLIKKVYSSFIHKVSYRFKRK